VAVHPLREARELAGFTLRYESAITGIDYRRLHLFEQGLRPKAHELRVLAAAFRVPMSELAAALGFEKPNAPSDV
jgi:transcriptional regulator with XRE-family HTH domain